jgi:prepilin-type N-terminal cleavage/methylation domain-containing protein
MNKTLKKNSSFTLIELLVVIVIIGILAGLVTIAATSFINNSHNARMVAELAGISKKLIGETEFPAGNFCMEDGSSEAKKLLDFLEMEKAPKHPLYNGGTHLTTNECFLYFSDGEHYSIRVPTVGNKGYLIQESRNPNPQGIQEKCEEGWIPFGNRCIMQYEAKSDGSTNCKNSKGNNAACPVSAPTAWASITQPDAKAACESIGAHLITNAEWMALARDIEAQDENWVGTGTSRVLKMGNVGNAAPINSDAWYLTGTGSGAKDNSTPVNEKARLKLSNGQTIYHFSGNVWEWVDYKIQSQAGIKPTENAWGYREINTITDWGATNLKYTEVGARDNDLTGGDNGIGKIYYKSDDSSEKAFLRGGTGTMARMLGCSLWLLSYSPSLLGHAYRWFPVRPVIF